MPVQYPPPEKLPVTMCEIPACPYVRRCQRGGYRHICQQHQNMWDKFETFDRSLNFDSKEYKYTRDGYPDPH
ncbi:UNVERIFIED_ORG: hypothetical protein M2328_003530 [Rhodococcus erythropolis]